MCPSSHPTIRAADGGPLRCCFIYADHSGRHSWLPPTVDAIEWPRVPGDVPERTDDDD